MQNLPKIVRARLQLQEPSASHPDADLLTAFAEHSLSGRERDSVVDHLARCGDCREVVALALPASEEVPIAMGIPSRKTWLTWPALRWGFVAGIVAVTSIGLLQFRHQGKTVATANMMRSQKTHVSEQNPAEQKETSRDALPATATIETDTGTRKKAVQAELTADKVSPAANAQFGVAHGTGSGSGIAGRSSGATAGSAGKAVGHAPSRELAVEPAVVVPQASVTAKQNPSAPAHQSLQVPRNSEVVEVQSAAPAGNQTLAQNQAQDELAQNAPETQGPAEAVVRAKTSSVQEASGSVSLGAEANLAKIAPRWTISSSGALQRSVDGGKTWLEVDLAANDSANSDAKLNLKKDVSTAEARSQPKKMIASRPTDKTKSGAAADPAYAPPRSSIVFRALSVASDATEVWAGGSSGALYHTIDGGNLWVRVTPSDAGVVLTQDIVSVQFPDRNNGVVTTSNTELWTTSDAGQTWHRQ